MIEEVIFQLLVSSFDHGIGEFDIALSDQVSKGGLVGARDPVFHRPGILRSIVGQKGSGSDSGRDQEVLQDFGQIFKRKMSLTGIGHPVAQNSPGEIILYEIDIMLFMVGRSEDGGIGVQELQRGMGTDSGMMIFLSICRGFSF